MSCLGKFWHVAGFSNALQFQVLYSILEFGDVGHLLFEVLHLGFDLFHFRLVHILNFLFESFVLIHQYSVLDEGCIEVSPCVFATPLLDLPSKLSLPLHQQFVLFQQLVVVRLHHFHLDVLYLGKVVVIAIRGIAALTRLDFYPISHPLLLHLLQHLRLNIRDLEVVLLCQFHQAPFQLRVLV